MGLERYPRDVQEAQPDLLTIQFGLNDCNCWETDRGVPRVSEAAFVANLIEMIDRGRVFGASHDHPGDEPPHAAPERAALGRRVRGPQRPLLRAVAPRWPTRPGSCCATSGPRSSRSATRSSTGCCCPYPDHLHLSPAGNEVYAEAIWPSSSAAWTRSWTRSATWRCRHEDRDRPSLERPRGFGGRRHRSQHHGHLPARPGVRLRRPYLSSDMRDARGRLRQRLLDRALPRAGRARRRDGLRREHDRARTRARRRAQQHLHPRQHPRARSGSKARTTRSSACAS